MLLNMAPEWCFGCVEYNSKEWLFSYESASKKVYILDHAEYVYPFQCLSKHENAFLLDPDVSNQWNRRFIFFRNILYIIIYSLLTDLNN